MKEHTYPGDEIITEPNYLADYQIEIKAPAAEIWPWLVMNLNPTGKRHWRYITE